jgi:hypothetical protein
MAGRGVAAADYDNDGIQEVFVSNYRLQRNFLWDYQEKKLINTAGLQNIEGEEVDGYFGHSIGASWGDYDNDGDLDLFVANLAHPRFLDFSEKSVLYRNDGKMIKEIGDFRVEYYQFTDVTKQAGIKYDELHAEPNWFDADNDGDLDLFITTVYDNEGSYLYENMGNGEFQDITWLADARVLNSYTSAIGDIDNDGLLDIVTSTNGNVIVLHNTTKTGNKSLQVKPFWNKDNKPDLVFKKEWVSTIPNSPVIGARVTLRLKRQDGSSRQIVRELSCGQGSMSQNSQFLHFGIAGDIPLKFELDFGNMTVKEIYLQ